MKNFKKVAFVLLIISVMVSIIIINKFEAYIISDDQIEQEIDQNSDWELLDNNIFISRNLSFYFIDDNLINTILISRTNLHKETLYCLIQVNSKAKSIDKKIFKIKSKLRQLDSYNGYSCYTLECQFNVFAFEEKIDDFDAYFIHENLIKEKQTKRPIRLNLKYNKYDRILDEQSKAALCGPMLYLDVKAFDSLKQWIELNIRMGFEKIILYYIWIENMKLFKEMIAKYNNIVEIRPFLFIPNVNYYKENASTPYVDPEVYVKRLENNFYLEIHWVHHRAVINGCFLSSVKDYDRVAVIDSDELIIPRVLEESLEIKNIENIKCDININNYVDNLNTKYLNEKSVTKMSMWFPYSQYFNSSFVDTLFDYLKLATSNLTKFSNSYNVTIQDINNLTFSVLNAHDFEYLVHIVNFYENLYKKLRLESNLFDRIWFLEESFKQEFGQGKVFNYFFSIIISNFCMLSLYLNINKTPVLTPKPNCNTNRTSFCLRYSIYQH